MIYLELAAAWLIGMGLLVFVVGMSLKATKRLERRNAAILGARQDRADRTIGLPLAFGVEDRTAEDCPSVALAEHGGGYACELDEGHPLPHRNGVWVWDIGDDIVIDLGAVGDLAAAVNRTAGDPTAIVDAVAETNAILADPDAMAAIAEGEAELASVSMPVGCVWPSCTVADGGPSCSPDEPACEPQPTCDYVWGDHYCENAPGHTGQHDCPDCGAWIINVVSEPTPTLRAESIRCWAKYHYGLDGHYLCDLDLGHALPHADSRGQARVRWYGIGADEQVASW